MQRLLVDTSALVALGDRGEGRHRNASRCLRQIRGTRLFLTDYVLDETLTLLRLRAGPRPTDALMREVREARTFELVFVDPKLFWKALDRFEKFADQTVSFTDCTSFVVMEHFKLDAAFSFDDDFRRAGFRVIPE